MTPIGIPDLHPDPEQLCSCSEMASLVNELFKQLSEPLLMALQRRHIDEVPCLEAGRSLGISQPALKSRARPVPRAERF